MFFKVPMKYKIIAAYLKGLSKLGRMTFSFFEYLFFVLEIFTFLFYANEESDDVIGGSIKTAQHSIEYNSRNIKALFFKLGIRNVHHKRNIMKPVVPLP